MKVIIAFSCLILVASALSVSPYAALRDADAVTTSPTRFDNIGVDNYNYGYDTSNGISANEQGEVANVGTEDEALRVRGSYQYTGPDGVVYSVAYVADENGFQPQGAHLPVA